MRLCAMYDFRTNLEFYDKISFIGLPLASNLMAQTFTSYGDVLLEA